jgi:predicted kinase
MRERHTSFVLLCGPSGSGKSSYAARAFPDHDVISMDVLREELGSGREDQSVNGQVFQAALERLRQALRARRAVIWDATSLRYDTRRKLLSLAMDYGSHTTLITALTSPEALLKRNAEREHAVPKSVLLRQLDSFEWPRPEEAHRLIVLDDAGEVAWDSRASWSPAHR